MYRKDIARDLVPSAVSGLHWGSWIVSPAGKGGPLLSVRRGIQSQREELSHKKGKQYSI